MAEVIETATDPRYSPAYRLAEAALFKALAAANTDKETAAARAESLRWEIKSRSGGNSGVMYPLGFLETGLVKYVEEGWGENEEDGQGVMPLAEWQALPFA